MNLLKILPSLFSKQNIRIVKRFLSELGHHSATPPSKHRRDTQKRSPQSSDAVSKELKSLLWDFRRDTYHAYLNSKEWKAKRRKILKMAGYKCRKCGTRATQVHHETYKRIYNEKLTDLTALCADCHNSIHNGAHQT